MTHTPFVAIAMASVSEYGPATGSNTTRAPAPAVIIRTSATKSQVRGKGWGIWVTPKFGATGWEALIRHDNWVPNDAINSQKQKRDIEGIAYWFPNTGSKSLALLFDRDSLERTNVSNTTNYELKMLLSF